MANISSLANRYHVSLFKCQVCALVARRYDETIFLLTQNIEYRTTRKNLSCINSSRQRFEAPEVREARRKREEEEVRKDTHFFKKTREIVGLCCNFVFQLREFLRQERERQAAESEARRALEEERRRLEEERLERVRKYVKKT